MQLPWVLLTLASAVLAVYVLVSSSQRLAPNVKQGLAGIANVSLLALFVVLLALAGWAGAWIIVGACAVAIVLGVTVVMPRAYR